MLGFYLHYLVRIASEYNITDVIGGDLVPAMGHTLGYDGNVAGFYLLQNTASNLAAFHRSQQGTVAGLFVDKFATGDHGALAGNDVINLIESDMGDSRFVLPWFHLAALHHRHTHVLFAHNSHSQFSDSNTGENIMDYLHGGLSDRGRDAIAEMNRLGIMIDISHPSRNSIMQTFELSRAPVIASHSSARALTNHTRNLDDEMLLALKKNGGVVQTVAFSSYVSEARRSHMEEGRANLQRSIAAELEIELLEPAAVAQLNATDRATYEAQMVDINTQLFPRLSAEVNSTAPAATVSDFVDHIDYIVDLIGLEHVGISSDFDGGGGIEGWNDASETFNVTLELVRRDYSEAEIGMLWSGNLLRVLDDVQRIAADIQAGN